MIITILESIKGWTQLSTEKLQLVVYSLLTPVLLYFEDIKTLIHLICFLSLINVIAAIIEDGAIRHRKFFLALRDLSLYLATLAILYIVGREMGELTEGKMISKTVTWLVIYIYLHNILRNTNKSFPQNLFFKVLWYIINANFIKDKVPYLKESKVNKEFKSTK